MSSKASPSVIGAFVLGGLALLALGIVVFGGTRWFQERHPLVAYFPGSIAGLRVGAPVNFRGVNVGQVTEIKVMFEPETVQARIPVILEMDRDRIVAVGEDLTVDDDAFRASLFDKGFRAQLGLESFVTGLLSVNLDFFEDAPPPEFHNKGQFELPYPELPTIQSDLQLLQANAGEIAQQLTASLDKMNEVFGSLGTAASENRGRLASVFDSFARMAEDLSAVTPKLAALVDESTGTAAAVTRTADTANGLLEDNAAGLAKTLADLQESVAALRKMADQVNMVAENRAGMRDFTGTGLYEITGLAQDAQRMVDQITRVMEDLERDPARFLFGDRAQGVRAE